MCHTTSDCTVVLHTLDCCGTAVYVGIAKTRATDFASCEQARTSKFPPCGCASGPPTTEDGHTVPWSADAGAVRVSCEVQVNAAVGECRTTKP